MERKIALCVSQWSADSTLYAWSYAKQYFLRKQRDASGTEVLSRLDKLFVVHVVKEGKKEKEKDKGDKWCVGGPLLPPMRVALAKFPHEVIELEGPSVHATLLDFAHREGIDIMILGSKENKGTVQKLVAPGGITNSTSDTVKAKCKCPCLVVRPASARNEKMRIKSNVNLGALLDAEARAAHTEGAINLRLKAVAPVGTVDEVRRVCLAFENVEVGQHMLAWATKFCLFPDDEVYIVHCFSKSLMKLANKRGAEVGPEIVDEIEREAINVVSNTQLKEDAKHGLCGFLEENNIDLVITGSATTSRFRKTLNLQLGQASLSTHLLHHAPCPTLVIPYKSIHAEAFPSDAGLASPEAAVGDAEAPEASPARPNSSPPGPGQYPLTITSDDDAEADGGGGPHSGGGGGGHHRGAGRAASLRNALQSWRSIRAALGDRPGSGPQPALHATASGHVEFDEVAPPPPEGSRRGSRGGRLPAKASAPDLDVAARAAALQARVDEQDIELAALREHVRRLQEQVAAAQQHQQQPQQPAGAAQQHADHGGGTAALPAPAVEGHGITA